MDGPTLVRAVAVVEALEGSTHGKGIDAQGLAAWVRRVGLLRTLERLAADHGATGGPASVFAAAIGLAVVEPDWKGALRALDNPTWLEVQEEATAIAEAVRLMARVPKEGDP